MKVTIFGKGNIGSAVGKQFTAAGQEVEYLTHEDGLTINGEIVVLAIPYASFDDVISRYGDQLAGKIVIETTNPLNFETFDDLLVPADSSATAELQEKLPEAKVVKGFNTNFAATLDSGEVVDGVPATVLLASDNQEAKNTIISALEGSALKAKDAGSLKRARELEAFGFLQMTLAASEQTSWTTGFSLND